MPLVKTSRKPRRVWNFWRIFSLFDLKFGEWNGTKIATNQPLVQQKIKVIWHYLKQFYRLVWKFTKFRLSTASYSIDAFRIFVPFFPGFLNTKMVRCLEWSIAHISLKNSDLQCFFAVFWVHSSFLPLYEKDGGLNIVFIWSLEFFEHISGTHCWHKFISFASKMQ